MQISTAIRPSKHKYVCYGAFVLLVLVLGAALGLGAGALVLCLVLALVLVWSDNIKPKPVYLLSQNSDELWQAKVTTANGQALWQFYVNGLHDFGFCVVLDGFVAEPMNKHLRWVLFKDTMDFEDYCTLQALARFSV